MTSGSRPTVLVVDDDPQVGSLFEQYLEERYDVRMAMSGEEALEEIGPDVDVVLLDRRMADLSGRDVLRAYRERGDDHPVALVTAVEPDFDILGMGFDDYVTKPVSEEELRDTVQDMLLRQEYDELMREYFSLVSKVTTLEQRKSREELTENDEYLESTVKLDEIKQQAQAALDAAIEEGKFDSLYEELEADAEPSVFGAERSGADS